MYTMIPYLLIALSTAIVTAFITVFIVREYYLMQDSIEWSQAFLMPDTSDPYMAIWVQRGIRRENNCVYLRVIKRIKTTDYMAVDLIRMYRSGVSVMRNSVNATQVG